MAKEITNLNTSYVDIKQQLTAANYIKILYLNTSYVDIKHAANWMCR